MPSRRPASIRVEVALVDLPGRRLELDQESEPHHVEPVRGDGREVVLRERERGREVGALLVVVAEPVDVDAAQDDRAAGVVDDPGAFAAVARSGCSTWDGGGGAAAGPDAVAPDAGRRAANDSSTATEAMPNPLARRRPMRLRARRWWWSTVR